MIGSLLLPIIYRDFSLTKSDIQLEILEYGKQELLKKLSDGLLDMVFLPHNAPIEETFKRQKVAQFEIVCCCSKKNPIAKRKKIQLSDLNNTPLVLFENSFFQTAEIKKRFSIAKIVPNILLQTSQLSTMLSLISNDTSVGFAFNKLLRLHPDIVGIPLEEPLVVDISLVWRKEVYFSHSMKLFQEYITKNFQF